MDDVCCAARVKTHGNNVGSAASDESYTTDKPPTRYYACRCREIQLWTRRTEIPVIACSRCLLPVDFVRIVPDAPAVGSTPEHVDAPAVTVTETVVESTS